MAPCRTAAPVGRSGGCGQHRHHRQQQPGKAAAICSMVCRPRPIMVCHVAHRQGGHRQGACHLHRLEAPLPLSGVHPLRQTAEHRHRQQLQPGLGAAAQQLPRLSQGLFRQAGQAAAQIPVRLHAVGFRRLPQLVQPLHLLRLPRRPAGHRQQEHHRHHCQNLFHPSNSAIIVSTPSASGRATARGQDGPATSTKAAAPPSPAARHTSPVTLVRMEMAARFQHRLHQGAVQPRPPGQSADGLHHRTQGAGWPASASSTPPPAPAPAPPPARPRRITAAHSTAVTARAAICMIPSITGGTGS